MKSLLFCVILLLPGFIFSQIEEPDRTNIRPVMAGYYTNPKPNELGIFLTDEKSQNLFILREKDTIPQLFFNYPGDYKNYTISPDGKNIAFRKLEDGFHYLIKYNIDNRKLKKIFTTSSYCSNISFTAKNQMAFSVNDLIYIISGKDTLKNSQDERIIDMQISPDGNKIVIQLKKGKTKVLDANTFKVLENLPSFANSYLWSPNSTKLAFKKDFNLHVWDSESKSEYDLGEGTGASWSPDSEHLIFQKNTPIELKFVNADLYISKFDSKEAIQLSNTINRFEMQPIFLSENEILFLTYEDRQIIRAGLSNFKLENEKVLFKVSK